MSEFLKLLPPQDSLKLWLEHMPSFTPSIELISVENALGRIFAQDILAPEPLPAFDRSTVDGYAVHARDTFGASESLPAYLNLVDEIPMGQPAQRLLEPHCAAPIHTGGMLPPGADSVVMLEHSQITGTGELEVMRPVAPLENILQVGEDVQPGQLILGKGKKIRPEEIGGCLALGIQKINCYARPRIGILSSGDEVIPPDKSPLPGQIRDINSFSLSALVQTAGGEPIQYGILPDQADVFETGLFNALQQSDFVIITAGSSASTRDLTARVVQKMGEPGVLVHGVNIKPGKPTILAICNGKPIIGLPGNPVSAMVIARIFAIPVIQHLAGNQSPTISPSIPARLNVNLASQAGREDWIPVKLQKTSEGWNAEPIFFKSNLIFSLVQADGLICIPPESNGIPIGQIVSVLPL